MKSILLVEDDAEFRSSWSYVIKAYFPDIRLVSGQNLYDADYYVNNVGIHFDLMIIDFSYGAQEYVFQDAEQYLSEETDQKLKGWVWIKHFLHNHPSYDRRRIIGLSAFTDLLDQDEIESAGVRVIDKTDQDNLKLIIEIIRRL